MSDFIYQVHKADGRYEATVGKDGAKELAKRIGGHVLRRPCGQDPAFDFRDKFLASESELHERCAELEAKLAKVTAELDRALMDMAAGFTGITPGGD